MHPIALKSAFLSLVLIALSSVTVNASLVLIIDSAHRTLTWTGTATSEPISITEGEMLPYIRLGFGKWNGGTIGGESGLNITVPDPTPSHHFIYDDARVVIAPVRGSLYIHLGTYYHYSDDPYFDVNFSPITVSGNDVTFSFLQSLDDHWEFLESLDGHTLYFQQDFGGRGVYNYGDPAGIIIVIPEPAITVLLTSGLCAALLLQRRRHRR